MSLRKLTLSAIFLSAVEGGLAQSLTLGEHMVLRGYTGKAFGQVMANEMKWNSLHILTNNTSICAALVGSMASSYLDLEGRRQLQVTAFATPEEVPALSPKEEAVASSSGARLPLRSTTASPRTPSRPWQAPTTEAPSSSTSGYGVRGLWKGPPKRIPPSPATWRASKTSSPSPMTRRPTW